ncbi:CUE domain-containing protein 1 [Halyomorpha halys]|uniref:CUE domain-containing protein 1 n=1 Tax=Halyomorpha halys TaxID=286706 RepID=UPI0006D4CF5D|nr:CUE domain-containing protein 1 [Halyomorpha halys]
MMEGIQQTTELEFNQAMQDFKTMFPTMDVDVIEVVLRSNQGAVDATIDQLLSMSSDNEMERSKVIAAEIPARSGTNKTSGEPLSALKGWRPALLQPLPPGFLRLLPDQRQIESDIEDERIAMLLQNEEFMSELRWNKDFLSALDDESPPEERSSAFPSRLHDDDAMFKERLRNMGKLSRKKFSQLARVFTGKKKKSARSMLSGGPAPSRDDLLLREDHDGDY